MSEQHSRKEPESPKVSFSLHSNKTPGYTFTPVMKRPTQNAQELASLEEQAVSSASAQTQATSEAPKNNGGFAFAPVAEEQITNEAVTPEAVIAQTPSSASPTNEKPASSLAGMERVIPNTAPNQPKSVEKVSSKYRRLFVVLLLLLALLLAFFLLKPKAPETMESLQDQGTSLPIEFRPVDEQEAKRAEEQARLEAEHAQQQQQTQTMNVEQPAQAASTQPETTNTPAQQETTSTEHSTVAQENDQPVVAPKPTINKPIVVETAKKPATQGSVIYQPESSAPKVSQTTTHSPKPAQKVETPKAEKTVTQKVSQTQAMTTKPAETDKTPSTPVAVSSKTMVVPKGVSLMQVFRNHQLEKNLPDVNAMLKVNNIVSNLKVGERITVRLDQNGNVAEMRIGSGGRFIRQTNGSYIYK